MQEIEMRILIAKDFDVRIQTTIEDATGVDHHFVTRAQNSEGRFFLIPAISWTQEFVLKLLHLLCKADRGQVWESHFCLQAPQGRHILTIPYIFVTAE